MGGIIMRKCHFEVAKLLWFACSSQGSFLASRESFPGGKAILERLETIKSSVDLKPGTSWPIANLSFHLPASETFNRDTLV